MGAQHSSLTAKVNAQKAIIAIGSAIVTLARLNKEKK
jgi:hypothetical protein